MVTPGAWFPSRFLFWLQVQNWENKPSKTAHCLLLQHMSHSSTWKHRSIALNSTWLPLPVLVWFFFHNRSNRVEYTVYAIPKQSLLPEHSSNLYLKIIQHPSDFYLKFIEICFWLWMGDGWGWSSHHRLHSWLSNSLKHQCNEIQEQNQWQFSEADCQQI